jgi:hypothetical protein
MHKPFKQLANVCTKKQLQIVLIIKHTFNLSNKQTQSITLTHKNTNKTHHRIQIALINVSFEGSDVLAQRGASDNKV